MNKLNLIQRLGSETPAFWKKVQVSCLFLAVVAGYLFDDHLLSTPIFYALNGFFIGIASIAQAAVKDVNLIKEAIADPATLINSLPDLINQVKEVHAAVTQPTRLTLNDLTKQIESVETPAAAEIVPAEVAS
jgi:hypothetical protein